MSSGIRAAAKKTVQAELIRHRVAAKPAPDAPPTDAGGSKKGVQGKGYTPRVAMNKFSRDTGGSYFSGVFENLLHVPVSQQRRIAPLTLPTVRPRTARTAPRPRARRNRALVKAALCSLECIE